MEPEFDRGNLKIPEIYADWLATIGCSTSSCLPFLDEPSYGRIPSAQTMWSLTAQRCSELQLTSLSQICRIKYQAYGISLSCLKSAQSRLQNIQEKNVCYLVDAAIRMTSKGESLQSNRPDNKHMNVWELYILDSVDWNIEAKPSLLLWETISIMNEILAMAFEFWQPDISDDIHLFKEVITDLLEVASEVYDILLFCFRPKEGVSAIAMATAIMTAAFCIETSRSGLPVMAFLSSVAGTVEKTIFSIQLQDLVDEILSLVLPNTSDFKHVSMNWLHQKDSLE